MLLASLLTVPATFEYGSILLLRQGGLDLRSSYAFSW